MGSRTSRVLAASVAIVVLVAFWITLAVRDPDTGADGKGSPDPLPGIASDCSRPVDAELNRVIAAAPAGSTIRLRRQACYGIDGPLVIAGKSRFTLDGDGATVRALTSGGARRANIDVRRGTDVSILDVVVQGAFPGPSDDGLPGNGPRNGNETGTQPGVFLQSVHGATVRDVRSSDTGGDCVLVMSDFDPVQGFVGGPSADVVIEELDCRHTGRQGVAIVDGERVVVRDSRIGDVYACAIHIGTDVDSQVTRDIRIENLRFDSTRSGAVCNGGEASSPNVANISVVGNRMTVPPASCAGAVHIETPSHHQANGGTRTGYRFVDNKLRSMGYGFFLSGVSDVEVSGNSLEREREEAATCGDYTRSPPQQHPALEIRNVQRLHGRGNTWSGYDDVARVDSASSEVQSLGEPGAPR